LHGPATHATRPSEYFVRDLERKDTKYAANQGRPCSNPQRHRHAQIYLITTSTGVCRLFAIPAKFPQAGTGVGIRHSIFHRRGKSLSVLIRHLRCRDADTGCRMNRDFPRCTFLLAHSLTYYQAVPTITSALSLSCVPLRRCFPPFLYADTTICV